MGNEIVTTEQRALTVSDLKQRIALHKQVQKEVMKEGVHYGKIPGCGDKKTLLKPGYELLLLTFNLGITFEVEDLSKLDAVHYRHKCQIINLATGQIICEGVGECSSDEEKYKWKKTFCDQEWEEYDIDRKRLKWKKNYNTGALYQEKQIRTNPADVANTILKMSKKRCGIDGTITATGCSDTYTQDVGDDENDTKKPKPPMTPPQAKSETDPNKVTKPQMKKIQAMFKEANPDADSDAKRKTASMLTGKELKSMSDLTKEDAKKLIDGLEELKKMNAERDNEEKPPF